MKVSIIGGGGLVGSMTAYALQCGGVASHICLIDANKDMAKGQALDLLHGASLAADQRITAGDMDDVATSNIVVITAGLRRKPDESRLDLINRNVDLFLALLDQVKSAGLKDNAYLVVVSNPVDVLTYLAVQRCGLPWQRVIGLGTQLDTARFRSYLAQRLQVPPTQVQALILGEHGDSMVPIWSSATVAGLPLEQWPGFTPTVQQEVVRGDEDGRRHAHQAQGRLGLRGRPVDPRSRACPGAGQPRASCRSARCSRGCTACATCACRCRRWSAAAACRQQIELALTPKERLGIQQSARVLREIIDQVEARIGKVRAAAQAQRQRPGTPIPRTAWQTARR